MRRHAAVNLRKVLGSDQRWWACLEETANRHLHLHGEIECPAVQLEEVRRALRLAGGEWAKGSRHFQAKFEPHPDARWASYCAKSLGLATDSRRALMARYGCTSSRWVASFSGSAFTMSNSTRAAAKAALEELSFSIRPTNRAPGDVTETPPRRRCRAFERAWVMGSSATSTATKCCYKAPPGASSTH